MFFFSNFFLQNLSLDDKPGMQRCPYIHEMRERLLGPPKPQESLPLEAMEREGLIDTRQSTDFNQVGTVVKVGAK